MINLQINQRQITVPEGTRIITATTQNDITIPTMCYLEGYPHFTSCMICMVQDVANQTLLPACSTYVTEGMVIETENEVVKNFRQETLELLMGDHVGDCIAPCERTCPAHMDIPLMNNHIEAGRDHEALVVVKQHIALPAVLGRICPAPCENNCSRDLVDRNISICSLKCYVADEDLASGSPYLPACKSPSGKRVAIIGSGPAGLAAAYYLQQHGHASIIFDNHPLPGGMLRYGVSETELPHDVLDAEIDIIRKLGASFELNREVGADVSFAELRQDFDALVLATGTLPSKKIERFGVAISSKTASVNKITFETSVEGIFAGGGVVNPGKMSVRSIGHGKSIADSVNKYLLNQILPVLNSRSQSRIGKIQEGELDPFAEVMDKLKSTTYQRDFIREPINGNGVGISNSQATGESGQCIQCGCVSFDVCKLRIYSEQYNANAQRFKGEGRREVERIYDHPYVVFEPGKCIQCGLCVRIAEQDGEELGLTFIGRGFEVRVDAPLHGTMNEALEKTADKAIAACPSGALVSKEKICIE